MTEKTISSLKRKKVTDSGKNRKKINKTITKYPGLLEIIEGKMKGEKEKGTAIMLEKYPAILEKIEKKMKAEKLHPWVKEFAGISNIGKDEN